MHTLPSAPTPYQRVLQLETARVKKKKKKKKKKKMVRSKEKLFLALHPPPKLPAPPKPTGEINWLRAKKTMNQRKSLHSFTGLFEKNRKTTHKTTLKMKLMNYRPKKKALVEDGEEKQVSTVSAGKRTSLFRRIEDSEVGAYFQDVETDETVWELPEDGQVMDEEEEELQDNAMNTVRWFVKLEDDEVGVYFLDVETDETVWELPDDGQVMDEEEEEEEEELQDNAMNTVRWFVKLEDDEVGVYFLDVETDETVWELPEDGQVMDEEEELKVFHDVVNPMLQKGNKKR